MKLNKEIFWLSYWEMEVENIKLLSVLSGTEMNTVSLLLYVHVVMFLRSSWR